MHTLQEQVYSLEDKLILRARSPLILKSGRDMLTWCISHSVEYFFLHFLACSYIQVIFTSPHIQQIVVYTRWQPHATEIHGDSEDWNCWQRRHMHGVVGSSETGTHCCLWLLFQSAHNKTVPSIEVVFIQTRNYDFSFCKTIAS